MSTSENSAINSKLNSSSSLFTKYLFDYRVAKIDDDYVSNYYMWRQIAGRLVILQGSFLIALYFQKCLKGEVDGHKIVNHAISEILFKGKVLTIEYCSQLAKILEDHLKRILQKNIFLDSATRIAWTKLYEIDESRIEVADFYGIDRRSLALSVFNQLYEAFHLLNYKDGQLKMADKSVPTFPFFDCSTDRSGDTDIRILKQSKGIFPEKLHLIYDKFESDDRYENLVVCDPSFKSKERLKRVQKIAQFVGYERIKDSVDFSREEAKVQINFTRLEPFEKATSIFLKTFNDRDIRKLLNKISFDGLPELSKDSKNLKDESYRSRAEMAILHELLAESPFQLFFDCLLIENVAFRDKLERFISNVLSALPEQEHKELHISILDDIIEEAKNYYPSVKKDGELFHGSHAKFLISKIAAATFNAIGIKLERKTAAMPLMYFKTKIEDTYLQINDSSDNLENNEENAIACCNYFITQCCNTLEELFKVLHCYLEAMRLSLEEKEEDKISFLVQEYFRHNIELMNVKDGERSLGSLYRNLYKRLYKKNKMSDFSAAFYKTSGRGFIGKKWLNSIFNKPFMDEPLIIDDKLIDLTDYDFFDIRNKLIAHDPSKKIKELKKKLNLNGWKKIAERFHQKSIKFLNLLQNEPPDAWNDYYPIGVILEYHESRYYEFNVKCYSINRECYYDYSKPRVKIITDKNVDENVPYYVTPHIKRSSNAIWINPFLLRASIIDDIFSYIIKKNDRSNC